MTNPVKGRCPHGTLRPKLQIKDGSRPVVNFGRLKHFIPTIRRGCQNSTTGYAALFSFAVMLIIFTVVIGVFSALTIKSVSRIGLNTSDLKNIYAADGLADDVLRRIYDVAVVDAADGETLAVGDATVTLTRSLEGLAKRHNFSSLIYGRYSHNHTLLVDDTVPADIKIKEWKDSL